MATAALRRARKRESLRILVAHPGSEMFGSDRMLLESVTGLVGAGHRVIVTLPENGALAVQLERVGARVVLRPAFVLRKSLLSMRPLALVRTAAAASWSGLVLLRQARPDVMYVNTITIPVWPVLARLTGTPVIVHVHEAEGTAPALIRRLLATPILLADRVLVNSEFSRRVLQSSFTSLGPRATVVHNGVLGPTDPPATRRMAEEPLRVLYVGRLSHRKGVDVAIRAISLLRARGALVRLDILGTAFAGNERYERQLQELVVSEGIEDVVMMHGFSSDVYEHYGRCHVAVVPSRFDEPFGNTAVEAVLARRPVVVSDTSGLREAVEGYEIPLLVAADDPVALADALQSIENRWLQILPALDIDRSVARSRHSPEAYRHSIEQEIRSVARAGVEPVDTERG